MLSAAWLIMTAVQIWLFLLHPVLDRQIDLETRRLIDRDQFEPAHTLYVTLSTVQWIAGLFYLFCTVHAWRVQDSATVAKLQPVQASSVNT